MFVCNFVSCHSPKSNKISKSRKRSSKQRDQDAPNYQLSKECRARTRLGHSYEAGGRTDATRRAGPGERWGFRSEGCVSFLEPPRQSTTNGQLKTAVSSFAVLEARSPESSVLLPPEDPGESPSRLSQLPVSAAVSPWRPMAWRHVTPVSASLFTWPSPLGVCIHISFFL